MRQDDGKRPDCKVDRLNRKYREELNELIKHRRKNGYSLRDLESVVNETLLRERMEDEGKRTTLNEPSQCYEELTDGEDWVKEDRRNQLEAMGVDVSELLEDFVSYRTIKKHLNQCLGIDTSSPAYEPDLDKEEINAIKMQRRTEDVIEKALKRLIQHDALEMGEPEAITSVDIECGNCGETTSLSAIYSRGGCSCRV